MQGRQDISQLQPRLHPHDAIEVGAAALGSGQAAERHQRERAVTRSPASSSPFTAPSSKACVDGQAPARLDPERDEDRVIAMLGASIPSPEPRSMPLSIAPEPPRDCPLCPRLVVYRDENRRQNPDPPNGAAPSFGDPEARLLIVGLAPGRTGANRTGRLSTGDHAGFLLYETLIKLGASRTGNTRPGPTTD